MDKEGARRERLGTIDESYEVSRPESQVPEDWQHQPTKLGERIRHFYDPIHCQVRNPGLTFSKLVSRR